MIHTIGNILGVTILVGVAFSAAVFVWLSLLPDPDEELIRRELDELDQLHQ